MPPALAGSEAACEHQRRRPQNERGGNTCSWEEDGVTRRCMQRKVAWCDLVAEVIETDFLDWELLGAFGVLRLGEPPARSRPMTRPPPQPVGASASGCLGQLARAFGVDPAQLREEFLDHQRLATGART